MSSSDVNKGHEAIPIQDHTLQKPTLVELRNGKVIFKQKLLPFEKFSETMQDIVRFREMLEQRLKQQKPPLDVFPDEHRPLIAKLCHESEKSLSALAKHVHHQLLPAQDEGEENDLGSSSLVLPVHLVEAAIKSTLTRVNYGLEMPSGVKVPASLCVWRWEVKDEYRDWLPKAAKEKVEVRLAQRLQAKKDLAALFQSLSQEERDVLVTVKATGKLAQAKTGDSNSSENPDLTHYDIKLSSQKAPKQTKKLANGAENDAITDNLTAPARSNKITDPEKLAMEKEKKAAKAEKEKKVKESQDRSRTIMANFFSKPKVSKPSAPAESSGETSDFDKTFKPFVLKKDAMLAPINWFSAKSQKKAAKRPTDVKTGIVFSESELAAMSIQERLQSIFSCLPSSSNPFLQFPRTREFKTASILNISALMSELNKAEIEGSTSRVRELVSTLSSRALIPAKVLIHYDDLRPGYFGTWTRNSRVIGPRSPFARDVVALDYGYDSGEEWEEEDPTGEDVEDGEDDEAEAGEEEDSDLDSWLADDDEVIEVIEEREPSPSTLLMPPPPPKRKVQGAGGEQSLEKKRKVVIPLIPFAKGPCWERSIGSCQYDAFTPYKIHLFNDTPFPIDPFTFVSTAQDQYPTHILAHDLNQRDLVVPLSQRFPDSVHGTPEVASSMLKRAQAPPKTSFPDVHLSVLLSKITLLATGNMTFLVESVFQELREHNVRKNAIEAKLKEVGEKCKHKRIWVVKDDVAVAQGLLT